VVDADARIGHPLQAVPSYELGNVHALFLGHQFQIVHAELDLLLLPAALAALLTLEAVLKLCKKGHSPSYVAVYALGLIQFLHPLSVCLVNRFPLEDQLLYPQSNHPLWYLISFVVII